MDILLFTIVAAGLYMFSDWIVRQIESRRGAPLPNRSIIFFGIIMFLSVFTFEVLQRLLHS